MYLDLESDDVTLNEIYQSGNISSFLQETARLFISIERNESLKGRAFFEPRSDARLEDLSGWLVRPSSTPPRRDTILHVATELYSTGGHTRVMEDIVRAMPDRRHVVILTDLLGSYSSGRASLGLLEQRFMEIGLEVQWLPQGDILSRAIMLTKMVNAISPGAIFVNAHPFDTVAYGGISGKSAPRVLLLHHADSYPALGSSRRDYIHVDLTDMCHAICCSSHLHEPKLLPMSVEDQGVIAPDYSGPITGVTSGTYNKFEGNVGSTYAELLVAVLQGGVATMHHIGALQPAQTEEIYKALDDAGVDRSRVIFHGGVPSLSEKLMELKPNFVLNSHPIGGGKALIEALSLGLPLMHYSPPEKLPIYNWVEKLKGCIVLNDFSEVPKVIQSIRENGLEIGKINRDVYEERHTMKAFRQSLEELTSF